MRDGFVKVAAATLNTKLQMWNTISGDLSSD